MKEEPTLPPNCRRCGGSGVVMVTTASDYVAEDSFPRELPVAVCDDCDGTGIVQDRGEEEDGEA